MIRKKVIRNFKKFNFYLFLFKKEIINYFFFTKS